VIAAAGIGGRVEKASVKKQVISAETISSVEFFRHHEVSSSQQRWAAPAGGTFVRGGRVGMFFLG
jgi:hypothetical protein